MNNPYTIREILEMIIYEDWNSNLHWEIFSDLMYLLDKEKATDG